MSDTHEATLVVNTPIPQALPSTASWPEHSQRATEMIELSKALTKQSKHARRRARKAAEKAESLVFTKDPSNIHSPKYMFGLKHILQGS